MAWTAPMTAVANAAFTAAQFNTHVRDNLNETAPAKATTAGSLFVATGLNSIAERIPGADNVGTSETTASTSYTDLATGGPAVTATTGVSALLNIRATVSNNTGGSATFMSYAISGATTVGASDLKAFEYESSNAGDTLAASLALLQTGLTAGSNVFTAKYRVNGGTGTWSNRYIDVIPF